MSGIAIAAPTTPGRVETFCSCSRDRSPSISPRISSSAKTRAGTRMSSRASTGISHVVSSIRVSSDIEDDPTFPDPVLPPESQPVQRHRLHERARLSAVAVHQCAQPKAVEREIGALRDEPLRLGEEDELVEPRREQRGEVIRLDDELSRDLFTPCGT